MAGAIYSEAQESLAKAFKAVRQQVGMKQTDLANAIGKHQSYISDIERGQRRVDLIEFYVIAKAMGVDPVTLFTQIVKAMPANISI